MARKPPKGKSLAEVNLELAKEWHPTKNGDLTPLDFTAGSGHKAWWQCDKGDDHEWQSTIANRKNGKNCPICAGRKVVKSNCLATTHPEIAKEWHPSKNEDLTPYDVMFGSTKKVWWKCDRGNDHEWKVSIRHRGKRGSNCPICSNKKIVKSNCLATTHPEIAKEWHPIKNGIVTPFNVTSGSNKKVWWKCNKGDDHIWQISPNARVSKKTNCPICAGRKVVKSNCLATTHPEIAKEWHPSKNEALTPYDVVSGSHEKVWWKCNKGDDHEWFAIIKSRCNRGLGCPICSRKKVVKSNCLAITHPELAKEWHPSKNGDLTPYDVLAGVNKKIWWKCDKGDDHEWQAMCNSRAFKKLGCPICSRQKVVKSNCLATTNPDIAELWHPIKNKDLTPYDILSGSHKKVWWKCNKGVDHEWRTTPDSLRRGSRCPFCTLTPQSKQELTITFELIQFFKDINPKGFKTRVNGKLWTIDIYIAELNIGIEFDGSYWHKDKQAMDKLKTEQLNNQGFKVIRVRQEPLKKLFETDVISNQPFNGKDVTDKVLKQIMSMFDLSASRIRKIDSYLAKKELQNEKGLEDYIEMILTEKSENK